MKEKVQKFSYAVGQIVGAVFVGSVGACLCGLMIGLTVKLLMWIF